MEQSGRNAALIPKRGDHLRLEEVEFVPGPGRDSR